jgi:hypothetical protein
MAFSHLRLAATVRCNVYQMTTKLLQLSIILICCSCNTNHEKTNSKLSNTITSEKINKDPIIKSITFGYYCGECNRPYSTMYRLEKSGLYFDENDSFFDKSRKGDFKGIQLSDSKFKIANSLFSRIPQILLDKNKKIIECPECYDGSGRFLKICYDNDTVIYKTNADLSRGKYPDSLIVFSEFVDEIINKIK